MLKTITIKVNENEAMELMYPNPRSYYGHDSLIGKLTKAAKTQFADYVKSEEHHKQANDEFQKITNLPELGIVTKPYQLKQNSLQSQINILNKQIGEIETQKNQAMDNFINGELDKRGITDYRCEKGWSLYSIAERQAQAEIEAKRQAEKLKLSGNCPYVQNCYYTRQWAKPSCKDIVLPKTKGPFVKYEYCEHWQKQKEPEMVIANVQKYHQAANSCEAMATD